MYLADTEEGVFHVVLEKKDRKSKRTLLKACGGQVPLPEKVTPQPPDLPVCIECWCKINPGARIAQKGVNTRRRACLGWDTMPRLFNFDPSGPAKPLGGQLELFP